MEGKVNRMFKDKLLPVTLMLGLLIIVAAAGVITIQRGEGNETDPYLGVPRPEVVVQETVPEMSQVAGASNAAKETQKSESAPIKTAMAQNTNQGNDLAAETEVGEDAADMLVLSFTDASEIEWPAEGNVLLDYSMDQIICFPALDQYKYNPGLVIQPDVSTPVGASANARILEAGSNEEIGDYAIINLDNEYAATCGQLKGVRAAEGEYPKKGQALGYMSEPTRCYSVEGVNVFFELKHQNKIVDPLDYMEQGPEHYREDVDSEK